MNKLSFFSAALLLTFTAGAVSAQEPADTLKDVHPFGTHALELIREAGVEVISSPGAPGMVPDIYIHGLPVRPGMQPLFVVDGIRVRSLDGIAPESIGKIEVLKTASAMGIWGAEAAPGVVLITTRRASQKGFHAGYSFTGGFQSLAHEPAPMSMAEWRSYGFFTEDSYQEREQPTLETGFLQNHHLYTQYGGNKWSAYADFSVLDNDGPYPGREDSHRRYAASWSAEYHPLKWLSMETTGRWNSSRVQRAPDNWLLSYLGNAPVYKPNCRYMYRDQSQFSEFMVQGKIEFRPLPGLYVRGLGAYNRESYHSYTATWKDWIDDDTYDSVSADDLTKKPSGYQWGCDAGWEGRWKGHHIHVDGRFRRVKEEQQNRGIKPFYHLQEEGIAYGDDDHLVKEYINKAYEAYTTVLSNNQWNPLDVLIRYGSNLVISLPQVLQYKETGLSADYDWGGRYLVNYSFNDMWEEKLFGEGFQVHSVSLGWNFLGEPVLRRAFPAWWKDWSLSASWASADKYITVRNPDICRSSYFVTKPMFASATRRNLSMKASFQAGNTRLDLSASGYINDDQMYAEDTRFLSSSGYQEKVVYALKKRGVDLSLAVQGMMGPVHYSFSSNLSFYGDRVSTCDANNSFFWNTDVPYYVYNSYYPSYADPQTFTALLMDGEKMGGGSFFTVQDGKLCSYDEKQWMGNAYPSVTGSVRLSLGWKRWQFTVSGHGRGGQVIGHTFATYDALSRYYVENLRTDANPDGKYQMVNYRFSDLSDTEYALHPGSFFRIDQIRLDYTLPIQKVQLNVFASLENGFLFTNYPGSDPELALSIKSFEEETASYPSTRRTIFGLSVSF